MHSIKVVDRHKLYEHSHTESHTAPASDAYFCKPPGKMLQRAGFKQQLLKAY